MARPVKWRKIGVYPKIRHFAPTGLHGPDVADIYMKIEELEAIRLKDLEGLEQEACAEQMEVSRPTFHRILSAARAKVADSLVNGKGLRIEGGHFTRNLCQMVCSACGEEWTEAYENMKDMEQSGTCPNCGSAVPACRPDGTIVCRQGQCRYRCGRGYGKRANPSDIH